MNGRPAPSFAELIWTSLRIGNLTFGGGDPAMLALQRETVGLRKWLPQDAFTVIWSLARVTPGTNVVACFAGVGWRLAGWRGALGTTIASSLPAGILCLWLTIAERAWQDNPKLGAALEGIGAAVAGMMLAGAIQLLRPAWRAGNLGRALPVSMAAFGASLAGAAPIAILAAAAAVGWFTTPAQVDGPGA